MKVSSIPAVLRPRGRPTPAGDSPIKLRLAGIQAPGRSEGGGRTSWEWLRNNLRRNAPVKFQQLGREVPLGRVYVFLYSEDERREFRAAKPQLSINMQLVKDGNARSTLHEYHVSRRLAEAFFAAEREAQRKGLNVWRRCPTIYPFGPGG